MADYIYLLENRLSPAQLRALSAVRNVVRARELTLFLTGGAVRDLTGGGSVRDLDFTVQGSATLLRGDLEAVGGVLDGENKDAQTLFFSFPGGVRTEISSAMSVTYPKPGKPQYEPSSIIEDLRRRDFTANAMALSLNEGSYGLLMDPVNGIADIENRELRLVSNYGFIEDSSRLIRAVRLCSRLGFQMEARTQQRYDNAKEEDSIGALSKYSAAYELEEIFHEEDPLRAMRALDAEGWLKVLSPRLQGLKANDVALNDLHDKQGQLQTQGILADASAIAFPLLLGKMLPADVSALKNGFARPGFAREIDSVEERTKEFQARFSAKEAATPSAAWHMLHEAESDVVLSMYFFAKGGNVAARLKTFLTESPTARQRIPYATLQEMRITPDLPVYSELLDKLFFELMDGKLSTPEELKAYLEPYSPPAPPPTVNLRRARAKKEARPSRAKAKKAAVESVVEQEEALGVQEGILEPGTLTGPDRGDAPFEEKPISSTAPTPDIDEPVSAKRKESKKGETKAIVPVKQSAVAAAPEKPAGKLTKPVPAPMEEAAKATPHPEAGKEIAAKGKVTTPQTSTAAKKSLTPVAATAKPVAPARKTTVPVVKSRTATPATKTPVKAAPAKSIPAKQAVVQSATKKGTSGTISGKAAGKAAKKAAPVKTALAGKPAKVVKKSPANSPTKKAATKTPVKKSSAKKVSGRR